MNQKAPPELISLKDIYNVVPKKIILKIFKENNIDKTDNLNDLYHSLRVIENGFIISDFNKANRNIIIIYSLFHDIFSWDTSNLKNASIKSSNLILENKKHIKASDEEIDKAYKASLNVLNSTKSSDLDIGTCYDADMLDSIRKEVYPAKNNMNTSIAGNSSIIVLCNKKALNNNFPSWSLELVSSFV